MILNYGKLREGNLVPATTSKEDKILEKYGGKFLGTLFINEKEYHIWGHENASVPILDEIVILKEELRQAYAKIDELQEIVKKKSVEDSWKGCVDRQGGSFDEWEIAQRNWESGW